MNMSAPENWNASCVVTSHLVASPWVWTELWSRHRAQTKKHVWAEILSWNNINAMWDVTGQIYVNNIVGMHCSYYTGYIHWNSPTSEKYVGIHYQ